MYVSVPKNYSGMAFPREKQALRPDVVHPAVPRPDPPPQKPPELPPQAADKPCDGCRTQERNPLTCLLHALRNRNKGGFESEDFLLIGLIILLLGKEGNEDILLILAMLLLI